MARISNIILVFHFLKVYVYQCFLVFKSCLKCGRPSQPCTFYYPPKFFAFLSWWYDWRWKLEVPLNQCCGSGSRSVSGLDPDSMGSCCVFFFSFWSSKPWIRIWIRPDPDSLEMLDPDSIILDPQLCFKWILFSFWQVAPVPRVGISHGEMDSLHQQVGPQYRYYYRR